MSNESQQLTPKIIKDIIDDSLSSRFRIDAEIHAEHHEFIEEYIEEKRVRKARIESVKTQLLGAMALGVVGFLYWVGKIVAKKIGIEL